MARLVRVRRRLLVIAAFVASSGSCFAAATTGMAGALSLGCTSPTLPLPPPTAPTISLGLEPDTVKLTSIEGAEPNALIIVVNRNESLPRDKRVTGTIADERGSWEATVTAKTGDALDISQDTGSSRSPSTTITVR